MEPFPLLPKDAMRKAPAEAPADAMEPFPLLPKDAMRETKPDSGHGIKNWEDVPMGADPVDVGVGVLKNAIPSTARLAVGLYDAVRHASDTAGAVVDLAGGVISKLDGLAPRKQDPETKAKDEATLNAFTQHYANKYGSIDKITHTLANDPAEFLADLSAVTTPAGLLAKGTGTVAKVAAGVRNAGNAIDPFQVAGRAVRGAYRSVRPVKAAAPAVDIAAVTHNAVTPADVARWSPEMRGRYEASIAAGDHPRAAIMRAVGVPEVSRSTAAGTAPKASVRQAVEDANARGLEHVGSLGEAMTGPTTSVTAAAEALQNAQIAGWNTFAKGYHDLSQATGHLDSSMAKNVGREVAASLADPSIGMGAHFAPLTQNGRFRNSASLNDLTIIREHLENLKDVPQTAEAVRRIEQLITTNNSAGKNTTAFGGELTFQNLERARQSVNSLFSAAKGSDRKYLRTVIDGFDSAVEKAIPTHYVGAANPNDLLATMRGARNAYKAYGDTFVRSPKGSEHISRTVEALTPDQRMGRDVAGTPPERANFIETGSSPEALQKAQIELGTDLLNLKKGSEVYRTTVNAMGGAAAPGAQALRDFVRQSLLRTKDGKLALKPDQLDAYLRGTNTIAHHVFTPEEISTLRAYNHAQRLLAATPSKAATTQNLASGVGWRLLRGATAGLTGSLHSIPGSIAAMSLEHVAENLVAKARGKREFAPLAAKGPGVLARTIPRVSRLPLAAYEAGQMRPGATKPSERKSFPKDTTQRYSAVASSLTKDLGITSAQAMGIISNLHAESGIRAVNEVRPTIPGSRGGFGWAQWTGPRRVEFEKFAASKGLSPASDAANYGFLVHDLKTTYPRVLAQVRQAPTAEAAAHVFFQGYESRGDPKLESRRAVHVALARRFASTGGRIERNSGGRVEALIRAAEGAGRRENQATRPLLALPDAAVVSALSVANRSL